MKKLRYLTFVLVAMVAFACSPDVELREHPGSLPITDINIDDADPNQPILTTADETVFEAVWDFGDYGSFQGIQMQGFFPLKGTYSYTLTVVNGAGSAASEGVVDVPISNPDLVYGIKEYAWLAGNKGEGGKYWVWDQDKPGGDVSYMTADYDWSEFWWNPYAGEDGGSLPGVLNEIKFDLVGGFNFTRYESKDVVGDEGSFQLDLDNMTIKFAGANIPNFDDENLDPAVTSTGLYKIQVLSEYELLLWQDHGPNNGGANDYGWAWKFKARDLLQLDDPIYKLAGEKDGEGKSWVFKQDAPGDNVCYMTANYDWEEFWWNPYSGADGVNLPDYDNEIKFELDYTYTRFDAAGTEIEKGTYEFNKPDMTITLIDAHLPNYDDENLDSEVAATNVYEVKILKDGKLLLWQDVSSINPADYDYGWAWVFMPKE